MSLGLIVQDDAIANPVRYRKTAVSRLEFRDIVIGPDTFRGIAPADDGTLFHEWLRAEGFEPTLSFFRRSEVGQIEPNLVHQDSMMGDWTAILYLNPEPPDDDGTVFWDAPFDFKGNTCQQERFRVRAQFNRAIIFNANWWHSRAIFENYGHGDSARLIQVAFGKVA